MKSNFVFTVLALVAGQVLGSKVTLPDCGKVKPGLVDGNGRILGGKDAVDGEFPWHVGIQIEHPYNGLPSIACGGSILNRWTILTAAHCIRDFEIEVVVVGGNSLTKPTGRETYHKVREIILHEKYKPGDIPYFYDVGLVILETPIDFDDYDGYVNGICLPEKGEIFDGKVTLSGYGPYWYVDGVVLGSKVTLPDCGRVKPGLVVGNNRIIGGRDAVEGEFPWQVAIQIEGFFAWQHHCGGSILNQWTILTAAHCIKEYRTHQLRVLVGAHSLKRPNGRETYHQVRYMKFHGGVDRYNDVGLIILSTPIDFDDYDGYVNGICLPEKGDVFSGNVVVSGWGVLKEGEKPNPDVLQAVNLDIYTREECRKVADHPLYQERVFCAGHRQDNKGVCNGDSGGPLVQGRGDGSFVQAGIVSWGKVCGVAKNPQVYANVPYFVDWIEENSQPI